MIETSEYLNKRKRYYSTLAVKYEMVKQMKNREVVFMHRKNNHWCIRGLRVTSVQFLDFVFGYYNFFKKDYNVYVSSAKYKNIPTFPIDLTQRSESTRAWFLDHAKDEIYEYDLLLDFDCNEVHNFRTMIIEIEKLLCILFSENICFYYYPSGNNIQIIVPGSQLPFKYTDIPKFIEIFKQRFKLKYLDTVGIGAFNKIMKCPYSLVTDKVVLPIPFSDIYNFSYDKFDCNKIFKDYRIKGRGFQYENSENISNIENFKNFINKYYIK